jgi:tRNA A37 methylthiotransferase MiaB
MNVNDSEVIASVLSAQQYTHAQSAADAGVVLLNTCAIRQVEGKQKGTSTRGLTLGSRYDSTISMHQA